MKARLIWIVKPKLLKSKMKKERKGINQKYRHIKNRNFRSLVELEWGAILVDRVAPGDAGSGLCFLFDFVDNFIVLTHFCIKNPYFQY